ncbi:methionine adenosyltransferase [Plebeiibacterium sediminum]|uniref:S-adenosylmethionine synthase n=1 Tax=Plebeiibacterium sediminum TaxID=2992112 RepID=A0AAE3M2C5_9BACT|nr:methionine adenosyltransferase [Plebeiobacterium sediminum]MCW3785525.1 methionine adenosyltransferase [Plebeiobacterium sediminum]
MGYLFTSESVSEGHPDKVADQISDALLDEFLRQDKESKVAAETLVTTGLVVLSGEVKTNGYVPVQNIARRVIDRIGYTKSEYMFDSGSCGVISAIHEQSEDINRGVEREDEDSQGAGDQGMMFGYACTETVEYMPFPLHLSHLLLVELAAIRREQKEMTYLRPDSKSQVTLEYGDDNKPVRVHTIVISTQHDEFDEEKTMLDQIKADVKNILIPRVKAKLSAEEASLIDEEYILHVNPTGKFVIGGPHGDTGLTGRKIIVDTYGGKGAHGGGAFSGKDSSKVDRSAAYASRHIAKNMVAAGVAEEVLVQVAYAIGVAEPVGLFVNTYGTSKVDLTDGEIAAKINTIFDMRPAAIVKRFGLKNPIFEPTAAYGHVGRAPYTDKVIVKENGVDVEKEVEFFTWEKLDFIDQIKTAFGL